MPGGRRPGAGAPRGPRPRTIQRALIAAQAVEDAQRTGKKLATSVLDEFMHLFAGIAAAYQPLPANATAEQRKGRTPNEKKFVMFATLAVETAGKLAKFQSPTFRAVAVTMQPGDARPVPARMDPTKMKTIDGKVVNLADQIAVARTYARLVSGSKP